MRRNFIYSCLFYMSMMTIYFHGSHSRTKYSEKSYNRILSTLNNKGNTPTLAGPHGTAPATPMQGESYGPNGKQVSTAESVHKHKPHQFETGTLPVGTAKWWIYMIVSLFLTLFSGLCSGLTVGMTGIEKLDLEMSYNAGKDTEDPVKKNEASEAMRLLDLLKDHHLLLATLLLSNAAAMESLPIFLDALVPSWLAILLSTT